MMAVVKTYKYRLPERFDPHYLRAVLEREFGEAFLGWSETPTEIRIDFSRELSPEERERLDRIMERPPLPVEKYVVEPVSPEDIELEVGVRPVMVSVDLRAGTCVIDFDRPLSPAQRARLEEVLNRLISTGFKKVKRREVIK